MSLVKTISLLVLAGLLCGSAFAQTHGEAGSQICGTPILEPVSRQLGLRDLAFEGSEADAGNGKKPVIASACKAWSYDPSLSIVVFAYDEGIQYQKRLVLALTTTSGNKVVASYRGEISEDAVLTVGSGSLNIDTARYDLAPGVRAFGLDLSTVFSQGCVDGGLGPTRMLFIREGKTLRPVLDGFYLSTWTYLKGGPSCANGEREIVIETTGYSIGVEKTSTNGFRDLRITAKAWLDNGKKSPGKPLSYLVKYDGKSYPLGTFNGDAGRTDQWHYRSR